MRRILFCFYIIILLPATNLWAQDDGLDHDFQNWDVVRITVPIGTKWSVSMQNEVRLSDNVTKLDEYIFKLYSHYKFSKRVGLSFGYKFIDRPGSSNENDPWAEIVFPHTYSKWNLSHQVRFESRFYEGISGIIPRLRYLFNWTVQLDDSFMYATGFGAVRFNLAEKGTGPVAGFEQVRAYSGLGFHFGGFTRIEIGYLYKYEPLRDASNESLNVLHLNFFFTIKRRSNKPMPNDHFL